MNTNVKWIASLSEKKPYVALVAALLIAITALVSALVYKDRRIDSIAAEYTTQIKARDKEWQKLISDERKKTEDCQQETKDCNNMVIQRTDAFFKEQKEDYEKRINEQKAIDAKRDRLYYQRAEIVKRQTSKINTLDKTNNQIDEN